MTRAFLLATLALAAFGLVRVPWEARIESSLRSAGFRESRLGLDLRQQAGQLGFAVALGGFRSLAASGLSLRADLAFEDGDWDRLLRLHQIITKLLPTHLGYWEAAHRHFAYDVPAYYRDHAPGLSEGERIRFGVVAIRHGEQFLRDGIRRHPKAWRLYFALGALRRNRLADPCGAAGALAEAARQPGAPAYVPRFHAYALSECPGRESEAYTLLRRLYDADPVHRKPTLIQKLGELEEVLGLPPAEDSP